MNAFLWVLAVLLAAAFLLAGIGKLTQPKEKLAAQPRMAWTEDFSAGNIRVIGTLEVLAAIGLIVPPLVGVAPALAPLAALGLALLMLGAAFTHLRRHEPQALAVNGVLFLLAVIVAWGRFGPYHF
jgi:uncharacterized membrane protein YphA (DoxX/SURF4 family)